MYLKLRQSKISQVILLTLIAFIFYSVRLSHTMEIASDFGRDTFRALELWQNKEITFLGSPLAFANLPGKTVFFTSLSLYLGMIGLPLVNFSPIGVVIANIALTTISIYFFYLLAMRIIKSHQNAFLATVIYALSPITVFYARFFWTPNTLIPISVFFWYLATSEGKLRQLSAGFLAGFMFLIHYMAAIPISIYLLVLILKKRFKLLINMAIGLFVGVLPFLFFEIRNQFFLTQSFIANLQNGATSTGTIDQGNILSRVTVFFTTLFGFSSAELSFPTFLRLPIVTTIASLIIFVLIIRELFRTIRKPKESVFTFTILLTLLLLLLTKNAINIRYQFFLYPLIVLFASSMLVRSKSKLLIAVFITFMLGTSLLIITRTQQLTPYAIPIRMLERISQVIAKDNFQGSYNLTDAATFDAQAIDIRYFVLRDAVNKPQNQLSYINLDALYVVARNEQEIYDRGSWQFLATPNLTLVQTWPLGELSVFRFEKIVK
ncbi:MAG: glycosyltransferase family 39 protein [bacterium]